jgi:hypothetical protein
LNAIAREKQDQQRHADVAAGSGYSGDMTRTEVTMEKIKIGMNFTVFLLFFGVATLEALQTRNWTKAAFWLAIGIVFLIADSPRRHA